MDSKGQGALEYLLLIGGAVVIAAVVITVVAGGAGKEKTQIQTSHKAYLDDANISKWT